MTATATATPTATPTATSTSTPVPTITATYTPMPTITATYSPVPTVAIVVPTPDKSKPKKSTITPTPTATATATATATVVPTATPTPDWGSLNGVTVNVWKVPEALVREVSEHARPGDAVGEPIGIELFGRRGQLADYTLHGDGKGLFEVSTEGQISVAEGVMLNYEVRALYHGELVAVTQDGSTVKTRYLVQVLNADDVGRIELRNDVDRSDINKGILRAILLDEDQPLTGHRWRWMKGRPELGIAWEIIDGASENALEVAEDMGGLVLSVSVVYDDSSGTDRMAIAFSGPIVVGADITQEVQPAATATPSPVMAVVSTATPSASLIVNIKREATPSAGKEATPSPTPTATPTSTVGATSLTPERTETSMWGPLWWLILLTLLLLALLAWLVRREVRKRRKRNAENKTTGVD